MTHEKSKETLTPLEARFTKEYPIDWVGVDAYIRASGKPNRKSAGVQACKMLKKQKVQDAIQEYVQETLGPKAKDLIETTQFWIDIRDGNVPGAGEGNSIPKKTVLETLSEHGIDSDDPIYKDIDKLPSFRVKPASISEQLKASEHLAKYRAMFIEKKEVALSGAVTIVDDV